MKKNQFSKPKLCCCVCGKTSQFDGQNFVQYDPVKHFYIQKNKEISNRNIIAIHKKCYLEVANPLKEQGILEFKKESAFLSPKEVDEMTSAFMKRTGLTKTRRNLKFEGTNEFNKFTTESAMLEKHIEIISGGQMMFKLFPLDGKEIEYSPKVSEKPELRVPLINPTKGLLSDSDWEVLVEIMKKTFGATNSDNDQFWLGSAFLVYDGRWSKGAQKGGQVTHKDGNYMRWHLNNLVIIIPVKVDHEKWSVVPTKVVSDVPFKVSCLQSYGFFTFFFKKNIVSSFYFVGLFYLYFHYY